MPRVPSALVAEPPDMAAPPVSAAKASYQEEFHRRWRHLRDPHVRDLAWLLDAPNLLDEHAPQWQGRIAQLEADAAVRAADWLAALDRSPDRLHAMLDIGPFTRLGRYAEKLLVFYFSQQGTLAAHGVQVRAGKGATVGEFDFLLRRVDGLVHWELATKFYLLAADDDAAIADYFIGPNLADTLQAKMRKILDRQLALGGHPAAQAVLAERIIEARALIKGWLFLPLGYQGDPGGAGVSREYCRGTWAPQSAWSPQAHLRYRPLSRLEWLAPSQAIGSDVLDSDAATAFLQDSFARDPAPVMVATLDTDGTEEKDGMWWRESSRAFIVPDDWRQRAMEQLRPGGSLFDTR